MTVQSEAPLLRNPWADQVRAACAAGAQRLSEHFETDVAVSVPDWHHSRDTWKMSWVWLLGEQQNHGFRVVLDGRRCEIAAWAPGRRLTLEDSPDVSPEWVAKILGLTFGIS